MEPGSQASVPAARSWFRALFRPVLVLFCVALIISGSKQLRSPSNAPGGDEKADPPALVVAPSDLSFGAVWEVHDFPWTIHVKNISPRPITIRSFSSTCQCTTIVPTSLTLPPSETRDITLTLDLGPHDLEESRLPERPFSVTISPMLDEGAPPKKGIAWILSGTVLAAIRPEANELCLGPRSVLATCPAFGRLTVHALRHLARLDATTSTPELQAKVKECEDGFSLYEIQVLSTAKLHKGKFASSLVLRPRLPTMALPAAFVPVTLEVVSDVEAIPPKVHFGARPINTRVSGIIRLASRTGHQFSVQRLSVDDDALSVRLDPGAAFPGYTLFLIRSIHALGEQTSFINVTVNTEGGEDQIVIPVSCHGLQHKR